MTIKNANYFLEVFKIKINDSYPKHSRKEKRDVDKVIQNEKSTGKNVEINKLKKMESMPAKIETCYFCQRKFNINKDDLSHYKYGKYPMCAYCTEFYGFYSENLQLSKKS